MALEVPALEVTGDWGLSGSGGGALSGSELSHLLLLLSENFLQREGIKTGEDHEMVEDAHWDQGPALV